MAAIARHDADQLILAPAGVVVGRHPRRHVPHALRQIRQEAPNLRERVVLALGFVVHRTADVRVDFGAAEFFLGQFLAHAPFDDRRSRDKQLARPANHHREMRRRHARRAKPRHRAHASRDHRHLADQFYEHVESGIGRDVGPFHRVERTHAAAASGSVHQPHNRQMQFMREHFRVALLVADRRVGSAAAHREVVAADHHAAPVDSPRAADEVRRHDRHERLPLVLRRSGNRAVLVKRSGVEQPVDSLAYRELATVMLALDVVGPAHPFGDLDAAADFFDFPFPRHRNLPTDAIAESIDHTDAFQKRIHLIECETHRGFHASLGRGCDPCTRSEKTRKSAQRIFSRLRDRGARGRTVS